MSDAAPQRADPLEAAWAEIQRLRLERYVADLDLHGFSVVPPEIANPDGLHLRLREAVLDVAERRNGVRPDLEEGSTHAGFRGRLAGPEGDSPFGENFPALIHEDRVFEEAILNPVLLAMTTYLLGYSMVLSSMGALVKGPNATCLDFHADTLLPPPWPGHAQVANATYCLTDYSRDLGSTAFLPGSHKLCRGPHALEANVEDNPRAVAVEAAAGSILVWHGNTWHGAYNRRVKGLRMGIPVLMARPYMRPEEELHDKLPQAVLDRNPTRFAILTQNAVPYGWDGYKDCEQRNANAAKLAMRFYEETGGLVALNPFDYDTDRLLG